jgi:ABC-type multidrug transport system fused ATPase/permease subunit
MDDGKAVEFDSPKELLAKGGFFKDLVDKYEAEHKG